MSSAREGGGAKQQQQQRSHSRSRSRSRTRPTTPLRPSSRSSFRESAKRSVEGGARGRGSGSGGSDPASFPLNTFEPAFAELSDAVADLEANMMHFQLMHESLARFSESFASFLYGLNMNAFCVDFPEGPIAESFRRARQNENEEEPAGRSRSTERAGEMDGETTFMTTDTSFVENPAPASKPTPRKFGNPSGRESRLPPPSRGGASSRGRGGTARGRPSGLVKPKVRGIR
ncbi:DASH complex subunit dam1 [Diatrype stigma]|uniref:DASH complex subunit DAM1 n=1 Tax=Diatrype stigma TaxID=117547 RepID=A0AAN9UDH4_9PEZI